MEIIQTAEVTITDPTSQVSLTFLACPSQVVPQRDALADLPGGVSRVINALRLRYLTGVSAGTGLSLALASLLLETHADWAQTRYSQLSASSQSDLPDADAQTYAFAHYAAHVHLLPPWAPNTALRSLGSLLETPLPRGQAGSACLIACGATPLVLVATSEGIIFCGGAESMANAKEERRFDVLRAWRSRGTVEGPALRRYIGSEWPWSDDELYFYVASWARLHGLDVRHLPSDDATKLALRDHLVTVRGNRAMLARTP